MLKFLVIIVKPDDHLQFMIMRKIDNWMWNGTGI